jgi:hypothetical protein
MVIPDVLENKVRRQSAEHNEAKRDQTKREIYNTCELLNLAILLFNLRRAEYANRP